MALYIYFALSEDGGANKKEKDDPSTSSEMDLILFQTLLKLFIHRLLCNIFRQNRTHTHTQTHTKEKKNILFAYFTTDELAPVDF